MSLVSGALLITLIIFSLSVFYFVNRTESTAWRGRQSEAAQNAAATVSGFIQRVQDALTVISIISPHQLATDSDELIALLQENTAILEIIRMDSAGNVIASGARDKPILANLITIPQSQWYLQARKGQTYLGDVQLSANDRPYLIMAIPGADKGVVAARIQMDILWTVVNNIHFGESGEVIVITKAGNIIAHTNSEFVLTRQTLSGRPELSAILNAPDTIWSGSYKDFHNEQVVAATAPISGTDWIVITELSQPEAYFYSRTAIYVLGAEAFLLLLAASFIVARFVKFLITRPMEQLIIGADRVGQGDLNHRINMISKNEIGQLALAFNTMTADLEKQQGNQQKAIAYEYESQRARELGILLKASEATSSSLDFDMVMHTLASQLLELSGFESCFISEWDDESNTIAGRLDDSRTFWGKDKRDSYLISDFPRSKQVLLTGNPVILQGNFEAEEKQWMEGLKRSAVIILAIYSQEKIIGLAEIEFIKQNKFFDPQVIRACQEILTGAAISIQEPLSENEPKELFQIQEALLQATGAEVCSFSEWDQPENKIHNLAVSTRITWTAVQGTRFNPDMETWRLALDQGKTITFTRSEDKTKKTIVYDGTEIMDVESLIIFPLQKGTKRIGVIELYDFNHEIHVTPEQITLMKTIADKASYSIVNARLLQLTKNKLDEQTELLNEKEVLLKEIHHRVKNNLQIISSLLNLQSDQVKDTSTLRVLRDSQARVRSMALIHEKLYQSKSLAKINFGEYVQSLSRDLFRSYQRTLGDIQLNVQVDEIFLDLDYAIPCGLILNELMTNALKYAFPNGRNGVILVELRAGPDQTLSLKVADDGVGLPSGLDILKNKSLGLQLINSLVKQIDGALLVENSAGTAFQVSFKV